MSSPGQRRGSCGHAMVNFDTHLYCARCREKGKGADTCIKEPQSDNCQICNAFSEEQHQQLATPSYRLKKEKPEAKKIIPTPPQESEELVDPANVAVIGAVDNQGTVKSPTPAPPPEKKSKKDSKKDTKKEKSPPAKASTSSSQTSADTKIAELDVKWSERFNRLEALILSKNFEPTFSANVKVTLTHSPLSSVENVSEPFVRPSTSCTLPGNGKKGRDVLLLTHPDWPRASSHTNDSHCMTPEQKRLLAGSLPQTVVTPVISNVKFHVATNTHTVPGHSQKKEISPGPVDCTCKDYTLKSVKSVSCVIPLSCAQSVTSVKHAAWDLPVGARLQHFWKTWLDLGAGPKIVQILKEGYTLPFRTRPNLTRSPTVVSCYVNPHRNSYLLEALHQLLDKNAVELVRNQSSLGFSTDCFWSQNPTTSGGQF